MSFSVHDLLCLAPGYPQQAADLPDGAFPKREFRSPTSVGIVQLVGLLRKEEHVKARHRINDLVANDRVGEILVFVDSPGGSAAGVHDLHLAIARAATKKKVTAYVEDLAASAAYYAIAGASEIVMNSTGAAGSVGTYQIIVDVSRKLAKEGIDVLILRSGKHKGAGQYGAKITADQIEQLQSIVDERARTFIAAVARGRSMAVDRVADLADGSVLIGTAAVAAGLVDRIATIEDVLEETLSRNHHLLFASLTGYEAERKYQELVAERVAGGDTESWARHLVAEAHPQLARNVLSSMS